MRPFVRFCFFVALRVLDGAFVRSRVPEGLEGFSILYRYASVLFVVVCVFFTILLLSSSLTMKTIQIKSLI